jgi:hypothetical protein
MDVPGIGPGPAAADGAKAAREPAPYANAPIAGAGGIPPMAGDSVAALLRELSQSSLTQLLGIVESAPAPGQEAQAKALLESAAAAVAEQDTGRALDYLKQLAMLDPSRAEALASEPALASIYPAVERMVSQLAGAAKLNAESRLAEATRLFEAGAVKELAAREIRPETLLLVATRFLEAGGLANCVRSAEASGVLIDAGRWVPAPHAELTLAREAGEELRMPLRYLFPAWLALGVLGVSVCWWLQPGRLAAALEVWGAGVLVWACLAVWQRARR